MKYGRSIKIGREKEWGMKWIIIKKVLKDYKGFEWEY